MGKVRHKRHTYHPSAPKVMDSEDTPPISKSQPIIKNPFNIESISCVNMTPPIISNNIFRNVTISPTMLNQRLIYGPTRQEIRRAKEDLKRQEKNAMGLDFKDMLLAQKKLRKKLRHPINSVFKVTSIQAEIKKAQKKKTGVLTDMDPLKDALPTLNSLIKESSPTEIKPRTGKSSKTQAKEMVNDVNVYKEILQNSSFAADPFSTISTHIKLKLDLERKGLP